MSFVNEATSLDSVEEPVISLAEWVKNKKPMFCPFGQKEPEKFAFDITKADKIFDFLLQEGQIKLSPNHVIPSAEELKRSSIVSGTMQQPIVQMNARCSGNNYNRLYNLGGLNLITQSSEADED